MQCGPKQLLFLWENFWQDISFKKVPMKWYLIPKWLGPLNVEKLHKKCHFTDQLKKLQRRYEMTEDELHKKRAELREALHNDASPQLRPPRSNSRSTTEQQQPSSQSAVVAGNSNVVNVVDQDQQHHYKFKKYSGAQHSLPKMDMKSVGVSNDSFCRANPFAPTSPPLPPSLIPSFQRTHGSTNLLLSVNLSKILWGKSCGV